MKANTFTSDHIPNTQTSTNIDMQTKLTQLIIDRLSTSNHFQLSARIIKKLDLEIGLTGTNYVTAFVPTDDAIKDEMLRCGYYTVDEFTKEEMVDLFCIAFYGKDMPIDGFEDNYYRSIPIEGVSYDAYIFHPDKKKKELHIMEMAQINMPDDIIGKGFRVHGVSHVCRPPHIGDYVHSDPNLVMAYTMLSDQRVRKYYLELLDKNQNISFFIGDNNAVTQLMKMNNADRFSDFLPAFMEYVFKMHTMEEQIVTFSSIKDEMHYRSLQGVDVLVYKEEGKYMLDYFTGLLGEFGRIDLKAMNGYLQVITAFHVKK